tara:strand:- start:858 stop:1232 length:375 start_codon:yes stop_codon:yes gene_type:complete
MELQIVLIEAMKWIVLNQSVTMVDSVALMGNALSKTVSAMVRETVKMAKMSGIVPVMLVNKIQIVMPGSAVRMISVRCANVGRSLNLSVVSMAIPMEMRVRRVALESRSRRLVNAHHPWIVRLR